MILNDTIVALSTSAGRAGLGVVCLSGNQSTVIARVILEVNRLEPRRATLATLQPGVDP